MKNRIYVADDEQETREQLASFLESDGFAVTAFSNADDLLDAYQNKRPDLVILDIVMPGTDGLTACMRLRREDPLIPIMIMSAMASPYDRVTGLTLGCDDYLTKPFLPLELAARVKVLLRRTQSASTPVEKGRNPRELTYGPLRISVEQRIAFLGEKRLSLTPAEFNFLSYLIQHAGSAVSRKDLLKNLWELDWQADTRATDDLVKRLRRKLREAGSPVRIETVWGFGFRLAMDGDTDS